MSFPQLPFSFSKSRILGAINSAAISRASRSAGNVVFSEPITSAAIASFSSASGFIGESGYISSEAISGSAISRGNIDGDSIVTDTVMLLTFASYSTSDTSSYSHSTSITTYNASDVPDDPTGITAAGNIASCTTQSGYLQLDFVTDTSITSQYGLYNYAGLFCSINSSALDFGANDFTIEAWVKDFFPGGIVYDHEILVANYISENPVNGFSDIAWSLSLSYALGYILSIYSGGSRYDLTLSGFATGDSGTTVHLAFYRIGDNFYFALEGIVSDVTSALVSAFGSLTSIDILNLGGSVQELCVGMNRRDGTYPYPICNPDQIDSVEIHGVRLTRGAALYTPSDFTPPSAP